MAEKKNIQKNDRKESGAGLAAGKSVENMTQQEPDARNATIKAAIETATRAIIAQTLSDAAQKIAKAAGEPVTIKIEMRKNSATFYVFGSEAACLRLAYRSRNTSGRPAVRFIAPLNKWCCIIEVSAVAVPAAHTADK